MKRFLPYALGIFLSLGSSLSLMAARPQVYGYQMGDTQYRFGFISFPADNLDNLSVVQTASDDSYVGAGEFVDGKYYTYTVYYDAYFEGGVVTDKFCVYNVNADGTKYTLDKEIDKYGTMRVTDMTFDYTTNTMYAIGESKKADSGKIGTTELYIVDMNTGDLYLVGGPGDITAQDGYGRTVHENIIAIACSPDGQLYGMGEYRQLYKLDKFTGLATATGSRHKIAVDNDYQSLAFAPDGTLYHAQKHPDYEYFMVIDPKTGALTNPVTGEAVTVDASFNNNGARFPKDPQVTGIYFKGFNVVGTSPLAPTNLTAVLKNGTSNTVDLNWQLPTNNYSGTSADITSIAVYRLGTAQPIATLDANATSYTDSEAPNGDVVYYVAAVSNSQQGFPAVAGLMAGADQLKAVTNLNAVLDGDKVTLNWTAPTETVNGGYADYDNITYIVNLVNGTTVEMLTDNLTATTYETQLSSAGTFTFEVIPVSCGIRGLSASSNSVTIEKKSSIPYFSGFEDSEDGTLWTVINPVGGNYGWSIELPPYTYQRYENKGAKFYTGGSSTYPADTWLVSPAIYMEPGVYKLSYVALGGSFDTHTYEVAIGTDPTDGSSFTNKIASYSEEKIYNTEEGNINYFQPYEHSFTIETAGEYHLGFHGIGNTVYATLRFDNVGIDKVADLPSAGLQLPYATSFEPDQDAWTYLNNENAPNQGWSVIKQSGVSKAADGEYYAQFKTASNYPLNALIISPALEIPAGDYTLTFKVDGSSYDTQTFDVVLGTNAEDAESFDKVLKSYVEEKLYNVYGDTYVTETINFSVPEGGVYYLAFNGKGNTIYATMKIDAVNLEKAVEAPKGIQLPYHTSFEPDQEIWTYLNNDNAPNQGWSITKQSGVSKAAEGEYYAQFKTASVYPLNALIISPAIEMPAGDYELSFQVDGSSYDSQTFDVVLGTNAEDAESFDKVLKSYVDEKLYNVYGDPYVTEVIKFSVPEDGVYHLAFNGKGNTSYATMKIDDLNLKSDNPTSGLGNLIEESSTVEYYDLNGFKVTNPVKGAIYIVRKGGKVTKQIFK